MGSLGSGTLHNAVVTDPVPNDGKKTLTFTIPIGIDARLYMRMLFEID